MDLVRTTIRMPKYLKKRLDQMAVEEESSVQNLIQKSVLKYLEEANSKRKEIVFIDTNAGPFDNLTRDDYYDDPKFDFS